MNNLHIMNKLTVFALALSALIGMTIHANAAILTFQEGDGGAFSATDASRFGSTTNLSKQFWLQGDDPTLNTDTSTVGRPDQYFMIGFFDLIGSGAGQVAAGSVTDNATLRFTQTDNLSNGLQAVYRVLKPWDEDTVNNFFFSGTSALAGSPREPQAGVDYDATAITTFRPNTAGFFDIDVTDAVQAWSNGADNHGLLVMNIDTVAIRATDGWVVHSDDATNQILRPLLTVTTAVPEPASIALLMLGGLIGIGFGRRRYRG